LRPINAYKRGNTDVVCC